MAKVKVDELKENVSVTLEHQGIKELRGLGDWLTMRRREYRGMVAALDAEGHKEQAIGYHCFANASLAVLNEIARRIESIEKSNVQVWKANVDIKPEAAKKWEISVNADSTAKARKGRK